MKLFLTLLLTVSCTLPTLIHATLTPSDKSYLVQKKGNTQYIYTEPDKNLIPALIRAHGQVKEIYEKEFGWILDQETSLFLASEYQQVSNGFATTSPLLKTVFQSNGAPLIDLFAASHWQDILLHHEIAHLYQLNVKSGFASLLHTLFGNALVSPGLNPFYPLIHTNQFMPNFLLEGNATFNESRFNSGGRLFSGELRARTYQILKTLTLKRLMNSTLEFDESSKLYIVGAYFFNFLSEKYGAAKVNSLFKNNARFSQSFLPVLLDGTFKRTFNKSYEELFNEFRTKTLLLAEKGHLSTGPSIIKEVYSVAPLHRLGRKIYFLTNKENNSFPTLNILSSETGEIISQESSTLPMGKVFPFQKGNEITYYSAAFAKHNSYETSAGLFKSYSILKKDTKGKVFFDRRQKRKAYVLAKDSFKGFELFVNEKSFGATHSSALLSSRGLPVFFKQEKQQRQLFHGTTKTCQYEGYYGKIADTYKNKVYFIAPTLYGSSLFVCENQSISRVLLSDNVIEAKRLKNGSFLIVEVGPSGYNIKTAQPSLSENQPILYQYTFKTYQVPSSTSIDSSLPQEEVYSYSSLSQLKLSGIYPSLFVSDLSTDYGLDIYFTDPASWNSVNLSYFNENSHHQTQLFYNNNRHNFSYFLAGLYQEEPFYDKTGTQQLVKAINTTGVIGWNYPLFRDNSWTLSFGQNYSYINTLAEDIQTTLKANVFGHNLSHRLDLNFKKKFSRNLYPYRLFQFSVVQTFGSIGAPLFDKKENNFDTWGGLAQFEYDLGAEFIAGLSYAYQYSLTDSISGLIESSNNFLGTPFFMDFPILQYGKDRTRLTFELKKPFHTPLYFYQFPISLRRIAPRITYIYADEPGDFRSLLFLYADVEILLLHKFDLILPFPLTKAYDITNNEWSSLYRIQFRKSF